MRRLGFGQQASDQSHSSWKTRGQTSESPSSKLPEKKLNHQLQMGMFILPLFWLAERAKKWPNIWTIKAPKPLQAFYLKNVPLWSSRLLQYYLIEKLPSNYYWCVSWYLGHPIKKIEGFTVDEISVVVFSPILLCQVSSWQWYKRRSVSLSSKSSKLGGHLWDRKHHTK